MKFPLPNRFVPEREIGRGGMGVVYKAFDTAYGRDVAIKILPEDVFDDTYFDRFRREGNDLAGMSHPNVVRCYEFGSDENLEFIVMEYIDGGNLRSYVSKCESIAQIVEVYCQICDGLQHIHNNGVVHRDVKPANILFTAGGIPKITDFGISRRMDSDSQLTQTGTVLGTCSFLAPEMILKNIGLTPSADLYSMGVCLYESLTGQLPITGDNDYAVLTAHVNTVPNAPSELKPDLPKELDEITLSLLAKRPENRPPSAKAAGDLLRECLRYSLSQTPPSTTTREEEPTEATDSGQYLEGLITIDSEGRIESCNPDAAHLLGRASSELFGQPVERFLPRLMSMAGKNRKRGQTFQIEGKRRVEESISLDVSLTTTESARGPQITAHFRQGEMNAEAYASNIMNPGQFDFLTRLTHEVWTPMNGILGMTRLTLDTDLDPVQRKYLRDVEQSGERLKEVLNTIFDFARLGDGSLQLEPVPINLREFAQSALKPYSFQAAAKGLAMTTHIDPLVPDLVVADPARLKQILHHLLQNALQFTDRGSIGVTISRESLDDNIVELKFVVSDTGQGIVRGREKAVFRPFYQEDNSISRVANGVGLGLTIVEGLVHKMKGHVWVESQRGRGSIFQLVAPFGVVETPPDQSYRARLGALKLLLLDPAGEFKNLEHLLGRWGLDVRHHWDAAEAGEELVAARDMEAPYDLVITEVHGPHLDAYAFVERFKMSHEAFILVTGAVAEGDHTRCRLLGVDALLEKPVNATDLWDVILKVLKSGPRHRQTDQSSLNILLAEDNPVNQTLAIVLLNSRGHRVTLAENGLDVLDRMKEQTFDLILMDLQMPHMDGLMTTCKIRDNEEGTGRRIPIIALTAHVQNDGLARCLAAGMDAYLNKPLEEDKLVETIARVTEQTRTLQAPPPASEDPPAPPPEPAAPPAEEGETTDYHVIDEPSLLTRVGNNSAVLCSLLDAFFRLYGDQLKDIREAVAGGDPEAVVQTSHKFKGSVSNFSAGQAAQAAQELEELGRSGSLVGAEDKLLALEKAVQKLVIALKGLHQRHSERKMIH